MDATARKNFLPLLSFGVLLAAVYHSTARSLVEEWWNDPNYSHGFLIPVLAVYLAWQKREALSRVDQWGNWAGIPIVLLAAFCYYFGTVGSLEFAARISLILWIHGTVIFLFGLPAWRILLFPLLLMVFMIPLPYILYDSIAFPLKLIASNVATTMLRWAGVPVFLEGNVISLSTMTLEVADACSGIRSLFSLLAVASLVAYFGNRRLLARAVVVASAFPIAVLTNSVRIFVTGLLVGFGYRELADGFFHTFSGWLVFILGFALMILASRAVAYLEPKVETPSP